MILLRLAMKSLRNRLFSTTLTVVSICLSMTLLLTVERAKRAAEDGFTQTISRTDLIVGARSGPLQLVLYTVFNMGNATHNISYETYETLKKHPAIEWTIPYSLGDGHEGFRVVGTNEDFFKYYHFRGRNKVAFQKGKPFSELWDVVVGSDVAKKLDYQVGSKIVVAHGVTKTAGVQLHDDRPFVVSGILKATGTPLDRAVYVSLEGLEALHIDWVDGSAPSLDKMIPREKLTKEMLKVHSITSFFVGAKSRIETLRLQREINSFKDEPVLAIIPGVVLSELWQSLGYIDGVLKIISWMVVLVGFMAMLIALTTTLNERRREMSILRAVGANSSQILALLVFESFLLTILGVISGVVLSLLVTLTLKPWIEATFGLYISGQFLTANEVIYVGVAIVGGTLIGLIPAVRAQQTALKDGLSLKI